MKEEIEREIVKFDLERLRGKEVVVNCRTKEQARSFINWVNSLEVDIYSYNIWHKYKEYTCLYLTSDLLWSYGKKTCFEGKNYEIISYKEALITESNKEPNSSKDEDKISFTKEQLKKFYLEAYNAGGLSKIVCGGLSNKDINNLDDRSWREALIKAYN